MQLQTKLRVRLQLWFTDQNLQLQLQLQLRIYTGIVYGCTKMLQFRMELRLRIPLPILSSETLRELHMKKSAADVPFSLQALITQPVKLTDDVIEIFTYKYGHGVDYCFSVTFYRYSYSS